MMGGGNPSGLLGLIVGVMMSWSVVPTAAFVHVASRRTAFVAESSRIVGEPSITRRRSESTSAVYAAGEAAPSISGEELEVMLTEWDKPLVIDVYATWCGPCLLMAPEFESAAKELEDKVRFVKLDSDKNEVMATKLNVMGLPTLLFIDQYVSKKGDEDTGPSKAVLKGRIEGALRKQNIVDLCEHHFFGGPMPKIN